MNPECKEGGEECNKIYCDSCILHIQGLITNGKLFRYFIVSSIGESHFLVAVSLKYTS